MRACERRRDLCLLLCCPPTHPPLPPPSHPLPSLSPCPQAAPWATSSPSGTLWCTRGGGRRRCTACSKPTTSQSSRVRGAPQWQLPSFGCSFAHQPAAAAAAAAPAPPEAALGRAACEPPAPHLQARRGGALVSSSVQPAGGGAPPPSPPPPPPPCRPRVPRPLRGFVRVGHQPEPGDHQNHGGVHRGQGEGAFDRPSTGL